MTRRLRFAACAAALLAITAALVTIILVKSQGA